MNKENIRNFVIISHIDHGKSTLADRFLEITNTISKEKMHPQYLDSMDLEREKGITIKMKPARMEFEGHILNLIDTPGHVDFSYEVSRSLAAVEGAILLVDATKGIQAQTLANLDLARKQNLTIIPAVNKIDSLQAKTEEVQEEIMNILGVDKNDVFLISAKLGTNVDSLLQRVIEKVESPKGNEDKPLRALIFDSKYDAFKGVIAYVRIVDGSIKSNDKIYLVEAKSEGVAKEIGFCIPNLVSKNELNAGEIGYIATGIKEPGKVRVGDTITNIKVEGSFEALPGYKEPKPMVFAGLYPENPDDFETLRDALSKLKLNDASLIFEPESKEALGRGFRCGFLGSLHAEIITERLRREYNFDLIVSTPSVVFKVVFKNDKVLNIYSPSDFPDVTQIKEVKEPWVKLEVVTPVSFIGKAMELLQDLSGKYIESRYFGKDRTIVVYEAPLRNIIVGFYDKLKGISEGYASMNYELLSYEKNDLVKLEIFIAGKKEEAFSRIVQDDKEFKEARNLLLKLKEVLPSQLYSVPLQAVVNGRVVARETIQAKRKDVIAPLYGGDYTRKRKLLEKQKKGKKKLKARGDIHIPNKVFFDVFRG